MATAILTHTLMMIMMMSPLLHVNGMETNNVSLCIVISPENIITRKGQTLFLPCVVSVNELDTNKINVTWKYNGHDFPSNSNVTIHSPGMVKKEGVSFIKSILEICVNDHFDVNGNYSCIAMGYSIEEKFLVDNRIHLKHQSNVNVTIGTSRTFHCDFLSDSLATISWIYPHTGSQITWQNSVTKSCIKSSYLKVNFYSILLSGDYTCMDGNNGDRYTIKVNVQVPSAALALLTDQNTNEMLSCAGYGVPRPMVMWKYGNVTLTSGITHINKMKYGIPIVKSFLELCPVKELAQYGEYSCEVDNGVTKPNGVLRQSVKFGVCFLGDLGFLVMPKSSEVMPGATLYFPCAAFSTNGSSLTILWTYANNTEINNSSRITVFEQHEFMHGYVKIFRSILVISCASIEDIRINYTCKASNKIQSIQTTLQSNFGPIIKQLLVDERNQTVKYMSKTSLTCIAYGSPIPMITWLKDGKPLVKNGTISNENHIDFDQMALYSTLILSGVTSEDEGYYWCRATNKLAEIDMTDMGYLLTVLDGSYNKSSPMGLQNRRNGHVLYIIGEVFCIIPLLVVTVRYFASRVLRSMTETIYLLNFCIVTSFLYVFHILSFSISWTSSVCAVFSSFFHIFFLAASISIFNLAFLKLNKRKKVVILVALLVNWGLPVLVLLVSLSPDVENYMQDICIPRSWPFWFGVLTPFVITYATSWMAIIVRKKCSWERVTIGFILVLFGISWVLEFIAALLPTNHATTKTILQIIFIMSSLCLGFVVLIQYMFVQSQARLKLQCCTHDKVSSSDNLETTQPELSALSKPVDKGKNVEVIELSNCLGDESGMVNKAADL